MGTDRYTEDGWMDGYRERDEWVYIDTESGMDGYR